MLIHPLLIHAGMEIPLGAEVLSEQADLIVTAEVISQGSFIREDQIGKHIHTEVTLRPLETLKGAETFGSITIEIIGGTYEGWREEVSYSPVFSNGEKAVLFLKGEPHRLVGARQGKRTIHEGAFIIDGVRITPAKFMQAIREHAAQRSKAQEITLKSIIESRGEVLRPSPVQSITRTAAGVLQTDDEGQQELSTSPRDLGGGTVPEVELPQIQK